METTTSVLASPFPTIGVLLSATSTSVPDRRGWVSQPAERGTMNIIWSCVSTLFICLWTMLHLNIPANYEGFWTMFWRKARWMLLGLVAPELPMLFACGQWASAQRSITQMNSVDWTIVHAMYADSGGFVLQPPDIDMFPITAKQVHYLVAEGDIAMPTITKTEIWDKSKADKVAKTITALQTLWWVAQIVARAIQHLPVTPLELSTIAIVFCSLTTLWFWLSKPLDVCTPTIFTTEIPITTILLRAGQAAKEPFRDTPLDFIEPRTYMSSKWSKTVLRLIQRSGLQARPLQRIPNDRDPQLSNFRQHAALGVATALFASIHFIGWNFSFPTRAELRMWRANCLVMWSLLAVYGVPRSLYGIGRTMRCWVWILWVGIN